MIDKVNHEIYKINKSQKYLNGFRRHKSNKLNRKKKIHKKGNKKNIKFSN